MKKWICSLLLCATCSFIAAQTISPFIVTDQLGYRPSSYKVAVLRDPQTGKDAAESYTPGASFALVDAATNSPVFTGTPVSWNGGATDAASGDKVWTFDFSSWNTSGSYYILDVSNNVRSYTFDIREDVYNDALKHALRTFFYQRSGFAKQAPYAEAGWTDGASHVGPLQDAQCRSYSAPTNAATQKDLHGGWYDAGDYNKYTTWTGNYIIELLKSYEEDPMAWTDDFNLPESGNGLPDLMDEIKWGLDYLLRLQNDDGSLISIVGSAHASPPSAATGQSVYGGVNTSCTLKSAAAFAYASKLFRLAGKGCYADSLQNAALRAWNWAENNPSVIWSNTDQDYLDAVPTTGGGDMEVDEYGRLMFKMEAAVHLFDLTGASTYKTFIDNNYDEGHLIQWYYTYPYELAHQETLLYYTRLPNATASVVNTIKSRYNTGIEKDNAFGAYDDHTDAYGSNLTGDYTWGSNGVKCQQGLMLYDTRTFGIHAARNADAETAAEQYIHYIHGLNPLQKFYLSNFNMHGAENSVTEFYHSWFSDGSPFWDKVGVSTYGPAPGFLVGGPNNGYDWDDCCPSGCGSSANNAQCYSVDLSSVRNQPHAKSYMDFNTSWPINSWEVTENSGGYQVSYLRLLAKFVQPLGTTPPGDVPCAVTSTAEEREALSALLFPNPSAGSFRMTLDHPFEIRLYSSTGQLLLQQQGQQHLVFGEQLPAGFYQLHITSGEKNEVKQLIKY